MQNEKQSLSFCILHSAFCIGTTAVVLMSLAGCGPSLPKTYPVRGKVVFQGGKPVMDGKIQFQSSADPQNKVLGDIDQDGSFSLMTYVGAKKVRGAPAGDYKVLVELERPARLIVLPSGYTVEPHENDFTIVVDSRRR
jgi:hypothetical protein